MANHAKCCVAVDDVLHVGGRTGFLLVHRLGGSPADMSFVTEGLIASGYTVSCPVLFGHCGSRELLGATTWEHWYHSVMAAHDELAKHCDTIVAAGHGVGALLAMHLAAERPANVQALVLMAPTFWPDGWAMPWTNRVLRLIGNKGLANVFRMDDRHPFGIKDDSLRRDMIDGLLRDGRSRGDVLGRRGGTFLELKSLAKLVVAELPKLSQACLIVHPRHDDRSSLAASQLLQRRLGGIVDLIVLEDSYHMITLDRQRQLVLDRVLDFAAALPRLVKATASGSTTASSNNPVPPTASPASPPGGPQSGNTQPG